MLGRLRPVSWSVDREVLLLDRFLDQAHHRAHRDAARDFTGVVAAHAVGEHEEADVGVDADRVLVVLAHATGIGHADAAQLALEVHALYALARIASARKAAAISAPS